MGLEIVELQYEGLPGQETLTIENVRDEISVLLVPLRTSLQEHLQQPNPHALTAEGIGAMTSQQVTESIASAIDNLNLTAADIDGAITQVDIESMQQTILNLKSVVASVGGDLQSLQQAFAALPALKFVPFNHSSWTNLIELKPGGYGKTTLIVSSIVWGQRQESGAFKHMVRHAPNGSFIYPRETERLVPDERYGVRFQEGDGYLQMQSYTPSGGANGGAIVI